MFAYGQWPGGGEVTTERTSEAHQDPELLEQLVPLLVRKLAKLGVECDLRKCVRVLWRVVDRETKGDYRRSRTTEAEGSAP